MSDNYDGKVNREVVLNLADWIERRRDAVGPYADHIIHSVRAHETEIAQLRAELEQERELADDLAHDLKGLLASYQEPDKLMCCNGQMCGCRGASERDMAEHFATEALTAHSTRRNK